MRARGLVVVVALVLATLATAGVFLYTQGVKNNAVNGGSQAEVVVAKVNIPANTDLNTLINQGQFQTKLVPADDKVEGAITAISDLRNRRNSVPILAGEQIPLARVQGGKVVGGTLGIDEGYQAITIALDAPAAVTGAFAAGDYLTIYATLDNVPVSALSKQQQKAFAKGSGAAGGSTGTASRASRVAGQVVTATAVLVPAAKVLRVLVPQTDNGGVQVGQTSGTINLAIELKPVDAQALVYALDQGGVYTSLLPTNGKPVALPPLTVLGVVGGKASSGK
jgi:Flp pilus assembly protein CpaB